MASISQRPTEYNAFKQYEPSEVACVIFIVIFAALLVAHIAQAVRAKIWYMWPLIASTALEVIGYILREYTIHYRHSKPAAIVSQVFIIVSPACLAAELYMLVGRAMLYVGAGYSIIRPSWITPIFVGLDVVSIGTQAIGAAVIFGGDMDLNKFKLGRIILIAGLFIQLAAFAIFLFFALFFDRKTTRILKGKVAGIRHLMNAFYIAGAFILLRSIYRAVEFISVDFTVRPPKGYLYTTEWPYYVLDALPIALSIGVFNIFYPAKYLPKDKKTTMDKDGIPMNPTNGQAHA